MTESAPQTPVRIGNAERNAAVNALDEHLAAGRIDLDEYGSRYAQALVARTLEDLRPLFEDLPAPGPFAGPPPASTPGRTHDAVRAARANLGAFAGLFFVLPVVVLAALAFHAFWLAFFVIPMIGRAMHAGRWGAYRGYRGYRRRGC